MRNLERRDERGKEKGEEETRWEQEVDYRGREELSVVCTLWSGFILPLPPLVGRVAFSLSLSL